MQSALERYLDRISWEELGRYIILLPPDSLARRLFNRLDELCDEEAADRANGINEERDECLKNLQEGWTASLINIVQAFDELEENLVSATKTLPYDALPDYVRARMKKFNDEEDPRNE